MTQTKKSEKWLALSLVLLILAGILTAWCPWLDSQTAGRWATSHFNETQQGRVDGCGILDLAPLEKELFGYRVQIIYDCGLKPSDSKEPPKSRIVFVTAVGIVLGGNVP